MRSSAREKCGPVEIDVDLAIVDLRPVRIFLQSHRMARVESDRQTRRWLPGRLPNLASRDVRRRIKPKAGDHGESVTIARVDSNPFAFAAIAKAPKLGRTDRGRDQSGTAERKGNCTGTVVGVVTKRFVSATITIRLGAKLVRGPNRALHY